MTSDPVLVMVLRKENAIKEWRALMGPTNPDAARAASQAEHPLDDSDWSLRALFGTAGPKNATHGSDSAFSALREISLFFPPTEQVYERTLAIVSSDAVGNIDQIVSTLEADGFVVVARSQPTAVQNAAAIASGDAQTAAALSSGPAIALAVEGFNAELRLKLRVGPSVSVAKANNPSSLRALFGVDDARPGVTAASVDFISSFFPQPLPLERTLALIKPGVAEKFGGAISQEIRRAGFTVLAEDRVTLSPAQAASLYDEHKEKPFFDTLVRYITSGPVIALALEKPGAVR
jgi:nucleoside diphosphate kinase